MSELLEPSLLTGEGGYYLTSLSASLALLSGLGQAHTLPLSPSQELRRSLSLWEQRRLPATHCFQHLLRVAYQDPSSGCTSKTLAVPPEASIATLNQLCATKFRVTQPNTFGLFLYKDQGYHRLPLEPWPTGCPPLATLSTAGQSGLRPRRLRQRRRAEGSQRQGAEGRSKGAREMRTLGSKPAPGTLGKSLRQLLKGARVESVKALLSQGSQRQREARQQRSSLKWPKGSFGAGDLAPAEKSF